MVTSARNDTFADLRIQLSTWLFPLARRFIAGLTLKEALASVDALKRRGFFTTLDHLGEDVTSVEAARIATDQQGVILRGLAEHNLDRNISVKPTHLGLRIRREIFEENLRKVVAVAEELHGFVRVDIEDSTTTTATFETIKGIKKRTTPIGAAVQAMLHRTPHDVIQLIEARIPLRLCKGAYNEGSEAASQEMATIRKQYIALMKRLLTSGLYHAIATHDEELISATIDFAHRQKIAADQFEFQMLYGVRPSLQEKLIRDGWRVRIYVPFGKSWIPYVYRRLRERKENVWFAVKNIFVR